MTWKIELTNAAARELAKLDRTTQVRIGSAIDQLAS
ncbi:type II toxin-antitoxin system RelE family toxin [Micromonospora rifamycinica]